MYARPPEAGARPNPRVWPRRVLVGAIVLVLIGIGALGAGYAYLRYRVGQIRHVTVAGLSQVNDGQPFNILLVGSDTRALGSGAAAHFGTQNQSGGERSDVTSVLRIDPVHHKAAVLSIPRDLFVPIAGTGHSDRINTAFDGGTSGDPAELAATIEQDFGIPISHYVEVNFDGFQSAVDALGGVHLDFPYQAKDVMTGLDVTTTNTCINLDGAQALGLARSRDYQYYSNGYWQYDPTGDLGRIQRQHIFLKGVVKAALSKGLTNPLTANAFLSSVVHNFTIDDTFSLGEMVALAQDFKSFDPNSMATYTLPTKPVDNYLDYGDVLFPVPGQQQAVVDAFLGVNQSSSSTTTTTTPPYTGPTESPSGVTVRVLNGVGDTSPHLAAEATTALRASGFDVTSLADAPGFGYATTEIHYAPGQLVAAGTVASQLRGPYRLYQDPSVRAEDVVVVAGSDWAGTKAMAYNGSTSSTSSTTTTIVTPEGGSLPAFDPHTC